MKRFPLLAGLILGSTFLLLAATLSNYNLMERLFVHHSYYLMLLLFFVWGAVLIRYYRTGEASLVELFRTYWPGILFSLAVTALIFISVKPYLRILSDEAELAAISQSMTYYHRTDAAFTGVNYGYLFRALDHIIPRRPLLFPFSTSLIHALLGYHANNVFILNFITLFSLLSIIYYLFRKNLGWAWGFAAVLTVACQPHVVETATSGGFDLFAVLFVFIVFSNLSNFMDSPSKEKFKILWIHLILLAHIRYESPMYAGIILFFLFIWRYIKLDYFKNSYLYPSTPLLVAPIFWQRIVADPPFNELQGVNAFSLSYFVKHHHIFFDHLLISFGKPPVATIVNALGMAGLALCLYLFLKNRWLNKINERRLFFIGFVCMAALWIITTSYFFSDLTSQSCSRYYTIFFILLSIFAVLLLYRSEIFKNKNPHLILITSVFFILYHPLTFQDGFTNALNMTRKVRFTVDFLKEQPTKNFLVVSDIPPHYTIYNMGAISFETAVNMRDKIMEDYENFLFNDIFVIQDITPATGEPTKQTSLDADYELEPVTRLLNSDETYIQISRVKRP